MANTSDSPPPAGEERLTPAARLFLTPKFSCHIIAVLGSNTSFKPEIIKEGLNHTLIKHPRFCSKLSDDGGKRRWVRTKVNLDDHVRVPEVDPEMATPPQQFTEDYISYLTTYPLDQSKPLWELHLLNVNNTPESEAVAVFKIHHSVGDGISLMSLLLACCRNSSDPQALPTLPHKTAGYKKDSDLGDAGWFMWVLLAVWSAFRLCWNTVIDLMLFAATILFLKDTNTPVKGDHGVGCSPKKIVHKTMNLNDIKLVKNAMGMTVNDVILGVTQAGLSRYLNKRYGEIGNNNSPQGNFNNLPSKLRLRTTILVNVRPTTGIQALADMMEGSKGTWGNRMGFVCVPLDIALHHNPLDYLYSAKATVDRKKNSLEAICTFIANKFITGLLGEKVSSAIIRRFLLSTTMSFSNIVGPAEEICFCGHSMAYLAPTVYGHPQALTIHFQSYINKMTMVVAVDPNVIPDPHLLCDHLEESLSLIMTAVQQKGNFVSTNMV